MSLELIKITDEKSKNCTWKIIDNIEVFIRDMRIAYSKTAWEVIKKDIKIEKIAELEDNGNLKVNKTKLITRLNNYNYETGNKIKETE